MTMTDWPANKPKYAAGVRESFIPFNAIMDGQPGTYDGVLAKHLHVMPADTSLRRMSVNTLKNNGHGVAICAASYRSAAVALFGKACILTAVFDSVDYYHTHTCGNYHLFVDAV